MKIESAKDLRVYQKAYALAMELFELSKEFPKEERYSITLQKLLFLESFFRVIKS